MRICNSKGRKPLGSSTCGDDQDHLVAILHFSWNYNTCTLSQKQLYDRGFSEGTGGPPFSDYIAVRGWILKIYTSTKTTFHTRLNAGTDTRIQLSSSEPDMKELCKDVKQCHSPHFFKGKKKIYVWLYTI